MTSYCRVEDELPKQVVHPADWNLKELVGHTGWTYRCSKVHLERELVRPPCLWRMTAKRKALLCNQWWIYLFYFYERV